MLPTRFALLSIGALTAQILSAQIPVITSIGPEEFVDAPYMEHPSVATDSRNQPHMVADSGLGFSMMKYHRVNGRWTGGNFANGVRGSRYDASRLYIGQIEIDARDRAWVSCKTGIKEYGSMHGQAVWLFDDVATDPTPREAFFRFVSVYKGMGLVSTDAKYPGQGVVLGTFGNWEMLNTAGDTLGKGSINAGHGGEKVRFKIASYAPRFDIPPGRSYADGVWHTAMNGSSMLSSRYQNSLRYKAGLPPVPWAEYRSYPEQGDDYCHPGLGIDLVDPRIAYIGSVFGRRQVINVWNGSRMLFNPYALKTLDREATWDGRSGTQFAPARNGGTFVFWSAHNRIKVCYLSQDGVSTAPMTVASGRSPGVATDRNGDIHLVYFNKHIMYRKLKVAALVPLSPDGTVSGTRSPVFKWARIQSDKYTVRLTRDGDTLSTATVPGTTWTSATDLAVGRYSWRVKAGWAGSDSPWSKPLLFSIPPATPAPLAPASRFDAALAPVFQWEGLDPEATRYTIQLFSDSDLLGTLAVTGAAPAALTHFAQWRKSLGAGLYSWRVRAGRVRGGDTLEGAWSPLTEFQVLLPGATAITQPGAKDSIPAGNGTLDCVWTPSETADSYKVKLLYNGATLDVYHNVGETNLSLIRFFQPGYHTLLVQPKNDAGLGPWSAPVTILVDRLMKPDQRDTLSRTPWKLSWTRTKGATVYRMRLQKYNWKTKSYVQLRERWVSQPPAGTDPAWRPAADLSDGGYRWSVTDYFGKRHGYTSTAYFKIDSTKSGAEPVDEMAEEPVLTPEEELPMS